MKFCFTEKFELLKYYCQIKLYLISVSLLFSCSLFSQQTSDYILYHQTCRQAEQYFIDSNYNRCFQAYDSVFNTFDFLFPRDCFIAAQLAYIKGKDSIAVEYLKKGVPFGLNANICIKKSSSLLINKITNCKYWTSYETDFDSLRQLYLNRVDWELKKALYEMVRIDQEFRIKNNKWFNRTFRKGLEKKFDIVNRKHIAFLDSVFKIKGYPGIWLTGVGDSDNIAFNNNGNLSEIFYVILYHYDSAYIRFGDFLYNEIKNGHLNPRVYAMIRDFNDRYFVKKDKNQKMYYNIWWEEKNYSEQEFEKHCADIGCPTKKHLRLLYEAASGKNSDFFWFPFR
jgi:hypothetical protein